jgi:hypothetical protein
MAAAVSMDGNTLHQTIREFTRAVRFLLDCAGKPDAADA